MTIEEIEKNLAISFHDALLIRISIDYIKNNVDLELNVCTGDPYSNNEIVREQRKKIRLRLNNILFFIIEKPNNIPPAQNENELMIDMDEIRTLKNKNKLSDLLKSIPKEAIAYWIFVVQWNSFIYFSALDAEFEWI